MVEVVSYNHYFDIVLLSPLGVFGGPPMLSLTLGTIIQVHMGVGGRGQG